MAAEIKKLANAGQLSSAKILAKQIVKIRAQKEKLYKAKGTLTSTSVMATSMQAHSTVATGLSGATKAMMVSNQAVPMKAMQNTMMQFEKQNEIANMKEEMIDSAFEDPDEEEEADETMNQVLDSIGLDLSEQMSKAKVGTSGPVKTTQKSTDVDVEKLLASLDGK